MRLPPAPTSSEQLKDRAKNPPYLSAPRRDCLSACLALQMEEEEGGEEAVRDLKVISRPGL